ncbi:MAG TPA: transposase domain-containing protein [Oligoflexus sp.]|nr:transposase domain-containing protein [Oligoflexus sp.]HYX38904.1 transposase domain-containing protein [Oligoflexus sp.]
MQDLRVWLDTAIHKVPPKSLTGQDTNPVENAIRPFALGRKAWLFSDAVKGANASAALHSLVITARANGIEPYEYLTHVFTELPRAISANDIEALLPWNFSTRH